jgi:hypothetical protein
MTTSIQRENPSTGEDFEKFDRERSERQTRGASTVVGDKERSFPTSWRSHVRVVHNEEIFSILLKE